MTEHVDPGSAEDAEEQDTESRVKRLLLGVFKLGVILESPWQALKSWWRCGSVVGFLNPRAMLALPVGKRWFLVGFPWKATHEKCGGVAYYVDHAWWNGKRTDPGFIALFAGMSVCGGATDRPVAGEGIVYRLDGCAFRCYPNGIRPEKKSCVCFTCGEHLAMFTDEVTVEYEGPEKEKL